MAVDTKAARKGAKRAGSKASDLRSNPYVQRLIEDPELRDNVRSAADSARKAYKRMQNGKGPAKALMEDRKLQRDLRDTADSLKQAADQARGKKKRHPFRKLVMLAVLGGIAALVISGDARKALLDRLFGAEEEFTYTSTTSPPVTATTPG